MDAYVRPQQGGDFERVDFEQSQSWNYEGMTKIRLNVYPTCDSFCCCFHQLTSLYLTS